MQYLRAVCIFAEDMAKSTADTGDVYFVPAFSGLYAPYWETDARGVIVGLTNYTSKAHLCRAALEAICFQSREVRSSQVFLNRVFSKEKGLYT